MMAVQLGVEEVLEIGVLEIALFQLGVLKVVEIGTDVLEGDVVKLDVPNGGVHDDVIIGTVVLGVTVEEKVGSDWVVIEVGLVVVVFDA